MPSDESWSNDLRFAATTGEGPFNYHPLNWQRWYRFTAAMHRLGAERPTDDELREKLVEMSVGDPEIIDDLIGAYVHGLGALDALEQGPLLHIDT